MANLSQQRSRKTFQEHVEWMVQWFIVNKLGYKHITFTMGDFRGFIHGLVGATRRILCDTLCVSDCESIPQIPWHAMYDDPTQSKVG
ncbi:hypothetical protein EYZ11_012491 [Aspergillus tanneri]|uniref:Uncharacterized protein n=1 Tax=Aspergillus tanneri TaxID=1220188 RepID=A0A4S3J047_9EURO|nr:hypothetical protein EYZ11_012491 [Aspergillus tanneri]